MLTIVFYASNGAAAKHRAREISAQSKGDYARCYDVSSWDNTPDKCDAVEIMPDVPSWQRDRITKVYGEVQEVIMDQEIRAEELVRQPMGLMPPKQEEAVVVQREAKHRGGGRWFVMSGDDIISGPHDKAEAIRLAEDAV
jgi:hypothetical protein